MMIFFRLARIIRLDVIFFDNFAAFDREGCSNHLTV